MDDVRGRFLGLPHGTTPAAVTTNKHLKVSLKKWGYIGFGLSVCVYVFMYGGSRYRLETSCMDSSWNNSRRIFLVFPDLSPLVKLRPFDKQSDEIL